MSRVTLFFDHAGDGRYYPQSRLAGEFCELVGRPYLTERQVRILKGMLFRIDTESVDRKAMRMLAAYRRPQFVEAKHIRDEM